MYQVSCKQIIIRSTESLSFTNMLSYDAIRYVYLNI